MSYADLIAQEKARHLRAPMSELRTMRVALALHSWGNTLQEKARAHAVDEIIHERLRAKRK